MILINSDLTARDNMLAELACGLIRDFPHLRALLSCVPC